VACAACPRTAGTDTGASLYLFACYLGSSVFGGLAGRAWTLGAWPGVVALTLAILIVSGLLTARLRHTPSLDRRKAADKPSGRDLGGTGIR
jgi:YNFM family putative membrane transporter